MALNLTDAEKGILRVFVAVRDSNRPALGSLQQACYNDGTMIRTHGQILESYGLISYDTTSLRATIPPDVRIMAENSLMGEGAEIRLDYLNELE